MHQIFIGIAAWVVLFAFYLVFAGEISTVEVCAALFCATVGAALAVAAHRSGRRQFRLRAPPKAIWRPLAALVPDFLSVGGELIKAIRLGGDRPRGDYFYQPFTQGDDGPRSRGRRAIAVLGLSVAPRAFVVRHGEGALLMHALPTKAPSKDPTWPA